MMSIVHELTMVKTKTGKYYHPVRGEVFDGSPGTTKRLGCMKHPTAVWPISAAEQQTMKPCITCAMWVVYGQERPDD